MSTTTTADSASAEARKSPEGLARGVEKLEGFDSAAIRALGQLSKGEINQIKYELKDLAKREADAIGPHGPDTEIADYFVRQRAEGMQRLAASLSNERRRPQFSDPWAHVPFSETITGMKLAKLAAKSPTPPTPPPPAKVTPKSAPVHEARFIAAILEDAHTLDRLNASRSIPLDAFEDYKHRQVWKRLRDAKSRDEVEAIAVTYLSTNTDCGMHYLNDAKALRLHALDVMGLDRAPEWLETLPITGIKGNPLDAIEARRLDLTSPPPRPEPVLLCAGVPVATKGDLTVILAPAKSGKSALVGAGIAAAVVSGEAVTTATDCLGITAGARPDNSVVLLIDTEQSEADQFDLAQRVARRAGVEMLPDWVLPYNLVGAAPSEIRPMVTAKLADLKAKGVPVWFVILDGIADLCDDPNDLRESQDLVREVHGHARAADCPIIAVIHRNEGRDADASARGHLGKQLARKAAFNLTLEKNSDEVTVIFSTKNRGAPILKKDGPRFAWSTEGKMHASVATPLGTDDAEDLRELAKDAFVKADQLTYKELTAALMGLKGKGKSWAQARIKAMGSGDVIRSCGGGKYVLV